MCGILYAKLKTEKIDQVQFKEVFEKALTLMDYRGKDSKGVSIINNNYFGHVRLSIVDLSVSSNQPFEDDSNLMIFNGEIYNYKDLDPDSESDTGTLFKLMRLDANPFEKIRGMFAFGWYDKRTDQVTFYRDFFGEKPLYYYSDENIDIVSSTLKSIVSILGETDKKVSVNRRAIIEDYMLFGYIREPETIWEDIFAVPPGHVLKITNNKANAINAIVFNLDSESVDWKNSKYVRQALASKDVLGTLLLSGGVDSTYLLSVASENNVRLHIGVYKAQNPHIDEASEAMSNYKKICSDKGMFPVTVLEASRIEMNELNEFSRLLEQPASDGLQLFHLLKHIKATDSSLRLVYTGLGGDEIFGGYPTFYNFQLVSFLLNVPYVERVLPKVHRFKEGRRLLNKWDVNVYAFLYRIDYAMFQSLCSAGDLERIYNRYQISLDEHVPAEVNLDQKSAFMGVKKNEMFQYCMNQLMRCNDNISMYLGFESRSPLLNPDWYFQKDIKKFKLKNFLFNRHQIRFGKKRGFTLDEIYMKQEFIDKLIEKEYLLTIFLPKLTIHTIVTLPLKKIRSILILLLWLEFNLDDQ